MDRSALVLVEFQKQWTHPGLYHSLIRRELQRRDVVGRAARLAERARARGVPVIHAPLVLDPAAPRGWLARLTFCRIFRRGTPAAEIDDRVYRQGDLVVRGRFAFDAFVGSDLEEILRREGVVRAFFAGFTADQCVARTVRSALHRGFDAHLVADCSATFAGFIQRRVEARFGPRAVLSDALTWPTEGSASAPQGAAASGHVGGHGRAVQNAS